MELNKLKKLSNEDLVEEFDCALSRLIFNANSRNEIKESTMEKSQRRYDNAKEELLRRLNESEK